MKPQPALFLALLLPTIASAGTATIPTRLTEETRLVWANRDQAGQLLGTSDLFIQSLSPFDRAVRLRSAPPPTTEGFLAFVGQQALDWSEDERKRLGSAFLRIAPRLQERHLPFPKTVLMIKTTGKEELDWKTKLVNKTIRSAKNKHAHLGVAIRNTSSSLGARQHTCWLLNCCHTLGMNLCHNH